MEDVGQSDVFAIQLGGKSVACVVNYTGPEGVFSGYRFRRWPVRRKKTASFTVAQQPTNLNGVFITAAVDTALSKDITVTAQLTQTILILLSFLLLIL